MKRSTIVILSLLTLFMTNCRDKLEPQEDDFVEYGWVLYENREYDAAKDEFRAGLTLNDLYIDGYNGLGWCYIAQDSVDLAIENFIEGDDRAVEDSTQERFEILAGLSFCRHTTEEYQMAINRAEDLYNADDLFEFSHNFRINYEDIIVLLATCYFSLGDYDQSLFWIKKLETDPEWQPDVSTLQGQAELALKIEELQEF